MSEPPVQPERLGAYGFRIAGLDDFAPLLVEAEDGWPALSIDWREDGSLDGEPLAPDASSTVRFTTGGAVIELGPTAAIELRQEPPRATIRARSVAGGNAVVHPYLGAAASVAARWYGRESFHAGAFASGSRAWGVLGTRTAGKSSLLAWLHLHGRVVLSDDVLVVDGQRAFAAPRTLDLRAEAAERLGLGEPLGHVGARERWRVGLGPAEPQLPLAGWVYLGWGAQVELEPVRGRERLARLGAHLTIPHVPVVAAALLELAALPSFELRRPRSWADVDAAGRALLDGLP